MDKSLFDEKSSFNTLGLSFSLIKLNLDSFYEVYFSWEYYYYYVWLVAPSSNLDMLEKVQKQVVLVPHLMFLLKPKLIAEL